MVAAGVLRHIFEVLGPGQGFQHLDGRHDVVIDDLAFGLGQRAGADGEVFELFGREEIDDLAFRPVRVAPAILFRDTAHPLLVVRLHGFATDVASPQKFPIFIRLPPLGLQAGLRTLTVFARQNGLKRFDLGVALHYFKARIDQMDTIEDGLQLGGLVDHVHRGRHLAAVVQQAGNLEFVAILVAHREIGEWAFGGVIHRFGQHHGQCRHALAMAAGIGRFFVDRHVDEVDEGLEQGFQLGDQQPVGQCHGRLRGQRLGQPEITVGESEHLAVFAGGVDQLQYADDLVLVVLHRHGEEGLRTIARGLIELAGTREIKTFGRVSIGYIDRLGMDGAVGRHHRVVRRAVVAVERQIGKFGRDRFAAGAAEGNLQRVGAHDLEMKMAGVIRDPIKRAAISVSDRFRGEQDVF